MPTGSAAATATTRSAVSSAAIVAAFRRGSVEVAHDLLVPLEGRRDVDDRVVRPLAARGQRAGDARGAELGPPRWTIQAGEDIHAGAAERCRDACELVGVEAAELRRAAGGGESGALVGEAQLQRDRTARGCRHRRARPAARPARARRRARSPPSCDPARPRAPTPRRHAGGEAPSGSAASGCGDAASTSARRHGSMSSGQGPASPKAATRPRSASLATSGTMRTPARSHMPTAAAVSVARSACSTTVSAAASACRMRSASSPRSSSAATDARADAGIVVTTAIPSRSSPAASALPCGSSTATRIVIAPRPPWERPTVPTRRPWRPAPPRRPLAE